MQVSVIDTPRRTKASIVRRSSVSIQGACLSTSALAKSVPRGSVIVGMRTRLRPPSSSAMLSSQRTPASPRLSVSAMTCAWVTGTKSAAAKKSPTLIWCSIAICATRPLRPARIASSSSLASCSWSSKVGTPHIRASRPSRAPRGPTWRSRRAGTRRTAEPRPTASARRRRAAGRGTPPARRRDGCRRRVGRRPPAAGRRARRAPTTPSPRSPSGPDSASVGTCGSTDERCALLTASARSLPPLTCCSTDCTGSNISGIWPPIRSVMRGCAALVGHVLQFDAGRLGEHLAGEMAGRAVAGRAEGDAARAPSSPRRRARRCCGTACRGWTTTATGAEASRPSGVKSAGRVVGKLPVERRVDRVRADRADQQRVAVGRRLGDDVGADRAAGAAAVVDDHLLPGGLGEHLGERPARRCRSGRRPGTARRGETPSTETLARAPTRAAQRPRRTPPTSP